MKPHDFHQHLVGIGGAVESAGAGAVIGLGFRLQQRGTVDLALGIELADFGLVIIGKAGGHGTGGNEHGRQMAE